MNAIYSLAFNHARESLVAVPETAKRLTRGSKSCKTKNQRSQALAALLQGGQAVQEAAKGDMQVVGAQLQATDTLSLGAVKVKRDASGNPVKDANGQYVADDGAAVQNLRVSGLELANKSWSEDTSGYKGPIKDLMKGVAQVASNLTQQDIQIELSSGSKSSTENKTVQGTTMDATTFINKSRGDTSLEGVSLTASKLAYIDAKNISIKGVEESSATSSSTSSESYTASAAKLQQDRVQVAGMKDTATTNTQTTNETTIKSASLNVGSLVLKAKESVSLLAVDAKVAGDLVSCPTVRNTLPVESQPPFFQP
jgi:Extended Signal Peptide of Type V secretion system/Hemagglutinin repeat